MENNNFNNIYNNASNEYPYGELPLKYTKQGQEQLKQELKRRHYAASSTGNVYNNNSSSDNILNQNFNTEANTQNFNINANNTYQNPVSAQESQNNSGLAGMDFNSLLPLLGSIGGNEQMETFKQLLPLINGNKQMDMNTMLKLFGGFNKKNSVQNLKVNTENNKNKIVIDNLKKVE